MHQSTFVITATVSNFALSDVVVREAMVYFRLTENIYDKLLFPCRTNSNYVLCQVSGSSRQFKCQQTLFVS